MSSGRRRLLIAAAVPAAAALLSLLLLRFTPYPAWEAFRSSPFSPVITDRRGRELRVVPLEEGLRRIYAPLEAYPDYVPEIFLASEDKRFRRHIGVDPLALIRAADQNRRAGSIVSGASTVTMQLAGLASPEPPTMASKLREGINALRLETRYSKEELLELWLSSLPFGSNIQGVSAAGRHFFGVPPEKLTREQALLLAVIPRRPELYDPRKHPKVAAEAAWHLALRGGIDTTREALSAAARAARESSPLWPFNAPHFINWIIPRLPAEAYGPGGPIGTTLDLEINLFLHGAIAARVEQGGRFRISNGSGLVVNNQNGDILGYVGSSEFFDPDHSGQIDGVQILRQPGSTLKPFLYALALESGFTAASILPDIPMSFGHEAIYIPQNYNQRYNGPVRLRTALSSSLNIPAVYLAERLGVDTFANLLEDLEFTSLHDQREHLGVGLALGNAEVSLYELVRAFSVFPRRGNTLELRWRLSKEEFAAGPKEGPRVLEESTAYLIQDILSDNVNRILGFGRRTLGNGGYDAMMKTGTSNQFNNIWAVGATPRISCGIWMGNFSGETVIGSPGSGLPADAVVEVLNHLQQGERFPEVKELEQIAVCPLSGGRATPVCPAVMTELFRPGEEPEPCTFHGGEEGFPVIYYPREYRNWAEMYGLTFRTREAEGPLKILSPVDGAVFYYDSSLPPKEQAVPVGIDGRGFCLLKVNGRIVTEADLPLRWFLPMERGFYTLRAEHAGEAQEVLIEVR